MFKEFLEELKKIVIPNFLNWCTNAFVILCIVSFTSIVFGIVITVSLKVLSYLLFL